MAHRRDRRDQDRQHTLLRAVFCEGRWRDHRAGERDVPGGEEERVTRRNASCPGRGAAFFMPLRRAGTVTNAEFVTTPALQRTAFALRCVRGTSAFPELPVAR